jgi:hypothetical protein
MPLAVEKYLTICDDGNPRCLASIPGFEDLADMALVFDGDIQSLRMTPDM